MPAYPMLYAGGALLIEKSSSLKERCVQMVWFKTIHRLSNNYRNFTCSNRHSGSLTHNPSGKVRIKRISIQSTARQVWLELMVSDLSQVYNALPASQKSQACIFTENYGEASAVNFLGRSLGLPEAISGHNNYYVWGPDSCTGNVLVTVGYSLSDDQKSFANVTLLTTLTCQYCISYEQNLPVYLCTSPTFSSIASAWPLVRHDRLVQGLGDQFSVSTQNEHRGRVRRPHHFRPPSLYFLTFSFLLSFLFSLAPVMYDTHAREKLKQTNNYA